MIKIRTKGSPDHIEGFMVWGHADYAPAGDDIICAGVSAVVTAALNGLIHRFPYDVYFRLLPQGFIYCRLSGGLTEIGRIEAQAILATMVLGLEAIRQSYPNHIDLAYRR